MQPLRLRRMVVPIKLVAEYGNDNDQSAEHEIKDVVPTHMSLLAHITGTIRMRQSSVPQS